MVREPILDTGAHSTEFLKEKVTPKRVFVLPPPIKSLLVRLAILPGPAAEHLFQNGGCRVGLLWRQISWDRMRFRS